MLNGIQLSKKSCLPSFDLLACDWVDSFHAYSFLKINPSHPFLVPQNGIGSSQQQANPQGKGYGHRDTRLFPSHTFVKLHWVQGITEKSISWEEEINFTILPQDLLNQHIVRKSRDVQREMCSHSLGADCYLFLSIQASILKGYILSVNLLKKKHAL